MPAQRFRTVHRVLFINQARTTNISAQHVVYPGVLRSCFIDQIRRSPAKPALAICTAPPSIALIQFVRGGYEAAGALHVIIFKRCCNSVRSFCLVIAPESLCRFMDAEPSRPNSWFFQLYNVGLHTPTDWAMVRALVFLVQSSTTAAFFISNGC